MTYRDKGWTFLGKTAEIQAEHRAAAATTGRTISSACASRCHAAAHGTNLYDFPLTPEEIGQVIIEYMADLYAPDWNPWKKHP